MHVGNGTTSLRARPPALRLDGRLAQQSLQADFDPALVLLFDRQGQGAVGYHNVAAGQAVSVSIDGLAGQAVQAALSNPFGFADFFAGGDAVHVSRAVSIAETAGGANNELAVVRMRQGGENSCSSPSTRSTTSAARSTARRRAMPTMRHWWAACLPDHRRPHR